MAIENFKPTIWSGEFQTELDKTAVLVDFCNREFEGEAKFANKVKILNVNTPTIQDYTGAPMTAEEIEDSSVYLEIDQSKAFYVVCDDVDKLQSKQGAFDVFVKQAAKAMKYEREEFVAAQAAKATQASASTKIDTADKAKQAVDAALLQLRENDVQLDDDVAIEIPPFVYQLMRDKYITLDTDNSEMIKKGYMGWYDNARVRVSNLLYNDGTDFYAMVRTKMAIAFAGQVEKTEAERIQGTFKDAVKGLNVYGAKIVRPKELYVIKAHK